MIQLNVSFFSLTKQTSFTYENNFILNIIKLCGTISVLEDGLNRIQFNGQSIYECIGSFSMELLNPIYINPPDLKTIVYDITDQV